MLYKVGDELVYKDSYHRYKYSRKSRCWMRIYEDIDVSNSKVINNVKPKPGKAYIAAGISFSGFYTVYVKNEREQVWHDSDLDVWTTESPPIAVYKEIPTEKLRLVHLSCLLGYLKYAEKNILKYSDAVRSREMFVRIFWKCRFDKWYRRHLRYYLRELRRFKKELKQYIKRREFYKQVYSFARTNNPMLVKVKQLKFRNMWITRETKREIWAKTYPLLIPSKTGNHFYLSEPVRIKVCKVTLNAKVLNHPHSDKEGNICGGAEQYMFRNLQDCGDIIALLTKLDSWLEYFNPSGAYWTDPYCSNEARWCKRISVFAETENIDGMDIRVVTCDSRGCRKRIAGYLEDIKKGKYLKLIKVEEK